MLRFKKDEFLQIFANKCALLITFVKFLTNSCAFLRVFYHFFLAYFTHNSQANTATPIFSPKTNIRTEKKPKKSEFPPNLHIFFEF